MAKYRSPNSVGHRKPIYISSDDPRARNANALESFRATAGAEVIVTKANKAIALDKYNPPPAVLLWSAGSVAGTDGTALMLTNYSFSSSAYLNTDLYYASTPIYAGSKFVALTAFTGWPAQGNLVYSDDLLTWTDTSTLEEYGPFSTGSCMLYANDQLVVVDATSIGVITDLSSFKDFVFKKHLDSLGIQGFRSMAYGNGVYVALPTPYDPLSIYSSTDLITWTETALPGGSNRPTQVAFFKDKFIRIDSGFPNTIFTSVDGVTWDSTVNDGVIEGYSFLTVGSDKAIITGPGDGTYYYSTDGHTWTTGTITFLVSYFGNPVNIVMATFSNGHFFVVRRNTGPSGPEISKSKNGIDWTGIENSETSSIYAISSRSTTQWQTILID